MVDRKRMVARVSDAEIGKALGCSAPLARYHRNIAGVKRLSCRDFWQEKNKKYSFWNIETKQAIVDDAGVMALTGRSAGAIRAARRRFRIKAAAIDGLGVIYLIRQRSRKEPWIKIGKSNSLSGVYGRLSAGQCWNPRQLKLHLVVEVPDVFGAEAALHRRFKKYNGHGEWFDLSDERLAEARTFLVDECGGKILYGQRGLVNAT